MANFPALKMTAAGRVLQSKAQTGQLLKFTRVGLGDGEFSGSPDALTTMIGEKQSLSIQSQETSGDGTSILRVIATNQGVAQGFYMREVGAYAQDPDTGAEVLYSYTNAGAECDFLPGAGGSVTWEGVFDLVTVVGNAANVTAIINDFITIALKSDVDAVKPFLLPGGGTVGQFPRKRTNSQGDIEWVTLALDGLKVNLKSVEEPRIAVANQRTFTLSKTTTNGLAVYIGTVDAAGVPSKVLQRLPREAWTPLSATQLQLVDALAVGVPVLFVNNEEAGTAVAQSVNIKGPTLVYPGTNNTYTLSDFDSFSTYAQTTTVGTLTRSENTLTLVIPSNAVAGTLDLTVIRDNVPITRRIAVGAAAIAAPEIQAPLDGAVEVKFEPDLLTAQFTVYPTGYDTHVKTQWQLATDSTFGASVLVLDLQSSTALTALNLAAAGVRLLPSKKYYMRVRFIGSTLTSAWAPVRSFMTATAYVRKPTITAPVDGAVGVSAGVTLQGDAFSVYSASDVHDSSRWQLSAVADFSSLLSDSGWVKGSLTSYKPAALAQTTQYYARVKYKGVTLGESDWSAVIRFVTANKLVGTYTQLNGGGSARGASTLTEIGGYLYLFGGLLTGSNVTNDLWRYDPAKNEWQQLASGGEARQSHVASAINGKLYITGGAGANGFLTSTYVYDPASNVWTKLASSTTTGVGNSAAATINGKMYVWGGFASGSTFAFLSAYDPLANTWTRLADSPAAGYGGTAVAINGKLYVVSSLGSWSYDPVTNTWAAIAAGPTARFYAVSAAVGGMMYLFGGIANSVSKNDLMCYDPATNTWSQLPAGATARYYHSGAGLNGLFYIFGPANDLWSIQ